MGWYISGMARTEKKRYQDPSEKTGSQQKVKFYYVNVNLIFPNWRVPSLKIRFNEGTRHLFQ